MVQQYSIEIERYFSALKDMFWLFLQFLGGVVACR